MRRICLLTTLLAITLSCFAQQLEVVSPLAHEGSVSAASVPNDNNGNPCAKIIVDVPIEDAVIEGSYIVGNVKEKAGRYEFYVSVPKKNGQKFSVRHSNYGSIEIPIWTENGPLVAREAYRVVLKTSKNGTESEVLNIYVKGVPFKMVLVEGGLSDKGGGTHANNINDFYISPTEVTVKMWTAIMGNNPSTFAGDDKPVVNVSWNDCKDFINKLNSLTGLSFRLPFEQEWEYAAKGGKYRENYKFSGSDNIEEVACYKRKDSPIDVASKRSNKLGIYDMSGNVWEWCNNTCDGSKAGSSLGLSEKYMEVVARGGCWYSEADRCVIGSRSCHKAAIKKDFIGFRLALDKQMPKEGNKITLADLKCNLSMTGDSAILFIGDTRIPFIRVNGGVFMMGATSEQKEFAATDEFPAHKVKLDSYYMSKEKVQIPPKLIETFGIQREQNSDENLNQEPISGFTYDEAESLVSLISNKLNMKIRLPTEAEWEYAARGANKSKGTIYSGTNDKRWYEDSPMSLNEIGLVGMSEGSQEWTSDWYTEYQPQFQVNPSCKNSTDNKVARGGFIYRFGGSRRRVSARNPTYVKSMNAVRLVMEIK